MVVAGALRTTDRRTCTPSRADDRRAIVVSDNASLIENGASGDKYITALYSTVFIF